MIEIRFGAKNPCLATLSTVRIGFKGIKWQYVTTKLESERERVRERRGEGGERERG